MTPIILITGGAQGLGAATALALARRGGWVAIADIDRAGACRTATDCERIAGSAMGIGVDLCLSEAAQTMVDAVVQKYGRLDVLINCAAVAPVESFLEMTPKVWETALLLNVRAIALSMAAAGRVMAGQKRGHVVNVSSAAARMAQPKFAAYAATKAAVDSLTRSGAVALATHGIRVNGFSPGMMNTPLQEKIEAALAGLEGASDLTKFQADRSARVPLGRRTSPEEMAEALAWLAIESPEYMTAGRLNVSGGLDQD